jgi:hypothetical protein
VRYKLDTVSTKTELSRSFCNAESIAWVGSPRFEPSPMKAS